jgi:hypothetical protein
MIVLKRPGSPAKQTLLIHSSLVYHRKTKGKVKK